VAKIAQERIKVIEDTGSDNDDEEEKSHANQASSRLIYIILQTSEGRKSRVKLQVTKVKHYFIIKLFWLVLPINVNLYQNFVMFL